MMGAGLLKSGPLINFNRSFVVAFELSKTCIQASNDIHIGKLLGREDELRATEIGALIKILTDFKEMKFQSNRDRIKEINDFKIEFIKELRNLKDEYSE